MAKVLSFFLTGDLERDIVIFEPLSVESMLLVAMDSCSLSLAKLPYCVARPYMSWRLVLGLLFCFWWNLEESRALLWLLTTTELTLPEVTAPEVTIPLVPIPDVAIPDVAIPDVVAPDVAITDVAAPEVTA